METVKNKKTKTSVRTYLNILSTCSDDRTCWLLRLHSHQTWCSEIFSINKVPAFLLWQKKKKKKSNLTLHTMSSVMLIKWDSHVVAASVLVWMQPQSNVLGYFLQDPQCHKPTRWGSFTYLLSLRCFWQIKTKPRQRWSLCWMPSHPEFIIVAVQQSTLQDVVVHPVITVLA